MESSVVAWPVGPETCYIQQRRTNRTFQAELRMPEAANVLVAHKFYNETLDHFLATDLLDSENTYCAPWWQLPAPKAKRHAEDDGVLLGLNAMRAWTCRTDCQLGDKVARELGMTTSPTLQDLPVVCVTATFRPRLLADLVAAGATPILPVFEIRSQLIIGPVLVAHRCPCPICLYSRLAANDISLEVFRSRCLAAESHAPYFTARDVITGLSAGLELPVVEATAHAIRQIAESWRLNGNNTMIRFDLVSGQQRIVKFQPLPGQHQTHWLRRQFQLDLSRSRPHGC